MKGDTNIDSFVGDTKHMNSDLFIASVHRDGLYDERATFACLIFWPVLTILLYQRVIGYYSYDRKQLMLDINQFSTCLIIFYLFLKINKKLKLLGKNVEFCFNYIIS